jgi:transcriptional regulator with XRE-family HTH domain
MNTNNNYDDLIDAKAYLDKKFGPFTFAMYARAMRTSKDMTQKEFACFLKMAPGTLCDIEKGRQLVSPTLAKKIAKKAGMSEILAVQVCLEDQLRKAKIKYKVTLEAA